MPEYQLESTPEFYCNLTKPFYNFIVDVSRRAVGGSRLMNSFIPLMICRRQSCSSYPSFWTEETIQYREYVDDEGNIVECVPVLDCPVCQEPLEEYECLPELTKKAILRRIEMNFECALAVGVVGNDEDAL